MTADELNLSHEHLAMLRDESGISDEVIQARGYRTITDPKELGALGFSKNQRRVPGLALPLHTTDGSNGFSVYRPDNPRVVEEKHKGKLPDGTYPNKVIKYEQPKGVGTRLDCPPMCQPMLNDPSKPLWIAEGQKKADALASHGCCTIAVLGVWNWKGKNEWGGTTFLNDFDYIAWDGRDVRIVYDSDAMIKPEVHKALERLIEHLQRRKAHVAQVYLPHGPNGKVGVDDWLAAGHTVEELERLVEGPRPEPKPAAPVVELLDEAPPALRRPLALIGDHSFAATWLYARETVTESIGKNGDIVKHNPPIMKTDLRLFVIRDDGRIFGEGGDASMDDSGLEINLPEILLKDKRWSGLGVKSYRRGMRPDPVDVFNRVVSVVKRFIDFDHSLADQQTMAKTIACYILATWFLDAFNVIGFLWPNGDRGSGKTHLLIVVAELAYLGQVILAGGSYASLRDLADYGATLAFDDAENLSDSRRSDPDKRALLLAGNRRGSIVSVKELAEDKRWRTRHVSTFCPRLFSAIQLPDQVLGSRSIIVPLIRTPDGYRANADPLDYELWPHDRRKLIDDLWAISLANLPKLPKYDAFVGKNAQLTGRNLQPWRGILAIAAWLTDRGEVGLWEQIEQLSMLYQTERPDLETGDLMGLVIRALCRCAVDAISAITTETPKEWVFKTAEITDVVRKVAEETEADIDLHHISPRRVGRVLGKMRLEKVPRPGGIGSRQRRVTLGDLERWTTSYGIPLPDTLSVIGTDGVDGTNGTKQDEIDLWEGEL